MVPTAPVPAQALAPKGDAGADRGQPSPPAGGPGTDDEAALVGDSAILRAGEDTRGYLVLRGVLQQWGIILAICNDRRKPITVDSTRFARVMRKLGIQQIYALSLQAKRRVDRMLKTFQQRLETELHLPAASTINEVGLVFKVFLLRASGVHLLLPGAVLHPERFSSDGYGPAAPGSRR